MRSSFLKSRFRIFSESTLFQAEIINSGQKMRASFSETVEKVPKQIFGRDAGKYDLTECPRISDLTITRGHETPKSTHYSTLKGFSTVSADIPRSFFPEIFLLTFHWLEIIYYYSFPHYSITKNPTILSFWNPDTLQKVSTEFSRGYWRIAG